MAAREITLVKGAHCYILRYREGAESNAIAALTRMARNRETDFDWLDAVILSHQLTSGQAARPYNT
jgi:hypothetical protein